MGGPTNTQPRYRPPPPGVAPPPPPGGGPNGGPSFMGGPQPQPQQHHQPQQQQQFGGYGPGHGSYAQPQPSNYHTQPQQQNYQQQSYYAEQSQPPQQNVASAPVSSNQSYAARSAAAHSPHGSQHGSHTLSNSSHSGAAANPAGQGNQSNPNNPPSSNPSADKNSGGVSPAQAAEQSRLLSLSTHRVAEASYHMQRAMDANDVCLALEKACQMLEELGDPNHGVHHRPSGFAAADARRYGGAGAASGYVPPPSYYSGATGAFPPSEYYGGSHGGASAHGGGSGGVIAPLSPKNYYELHMKAMDEMPGLEEYLLGLCHRHSSAGSASASNAAAGNGHTHVVAGGPTNAPSHVGGAARPGNFPSHVGTACNGNTPYTSKELYEAVQYTPRLVPRLYLQICMGSVSIRSGDVPAVVIMEELAEAAKCVQCPVRGLFLRHYLLAALKDKLPDGKLEEDEEQETKKVDEKTRGAKLESTIRSDKHSHKESGMLTTPKQEQNIGTHLESGASVDGPTSPPPPLPPPPPPLPPPPPPTGDLPLFSDDVEETPLFAESAKETLLFADSADDSPLFGDIPDTPPPTAAPPKPAESPQRTSDSATTSSTSATALPTHSDASNASIAPSRDPNRPRTGTVHDSYEFILQNLVQMNRLWVRIQHLPGSERTKESKRRRERERNELRVLVGTNLVRLSQLEGVSAHMYGSVILPRILEEVASCRDALAQAYLMDCVIQVFPDEFHIETLEIFLGVLPKLRDKVNVRTIINNMMERLLHYYQDELLLHDEVDTNDVKRIMLLDSFEMFEVCVQRVFQARGMNIPPKDVIRLQGALLTYALKIAPGNVNYISRCIGNCARELSTLQEQKKASMMGQGIVVGGGTKKSGEIDMEEVAITELEKLLSVPLDSMGLKILELRDFSSLLAFLPWENRRKVAVSMAKAIVGGGDATKIKDVAETEQLFSIIGPLLREEGDLPPSMASMYGSVAGDGGSLISRTANLMGSLGINPNAMHDDSIFAPNNFGSIPGNRTFGGDPAKAAQFREEQVLIAKLIHVLDNDDTDVAYQMLNVARKYIQQGGAHRTTVTLPSIVFAALRLLRRVQEVEFPKPIPARAIELEKSKEEHGREADKKDEGHSSDKGDDDNVATATEGKQDGVKEGSSEVESSVSSPTSAPVEESGSLFSTFAKSVNCRKILVFLQKTIAMITPNNPELGFKLYLEVAVATDSLAFSTQSDFKNASKEFSSISYDFMTQALLVYEDEVTESKAQIQAITSVVGSLLSCKTFERSDYEALITKTAQYSAKLLKKPDQCRMVCLCSRLFYVGGKDAVNTYRNPQRVLECLQRGLKIADACSMASASNVQLFVEILDYYVYYYDIENPVITDKFVSGLIALINEHLDSAGAASTAISETKVYYESILNKIRKKKAEKNTSERY
ncbi:hypothetical protein ACHAXS_006106, partial [Conticribra weissflogii]